MVLPKLRNSGSFIGPRELLREGGKLIDFEVGGLEVVLRKGWEKRGGLGETSKGVLDSLEKVAESGLGREGVESRSLRRSSRGAPRVNWARG